MPEDMFSDLCVAHLMVTFPGTPPGGRARWRARRREAALALVDKGFTTAAIADAAGVAHSTATRWVAP